MAATEAARRIERRRQAGRRPSPADLVLLKLYAGGPQDAWDIVQLRAGDDAGTVAREVEQRRPSLPLECRALWARIRAGGRA